MEHSKRRIVETIACERRYGIADEKGAEYSGAGAKYKETGADTLHNFKAVAERIGGTPEQVLLTYLLKHMDSITTTVREAGDPFYSTTGSALVYAQGEGIVSRLDDARNYLDLLECLLVDLGLIEDSDKEYDGPDVWGCDGCDDPQCGFTHPEPTRTSVGEDDTYNTKSQWVEEEDGSITIKQDSPQPGMVLGFDNVWRASSTVDKSVKPDTPVQTPIYRQGELIEPRPAVYGETGE